MGVAITSLQAGGVYPRVPRVTRMGSIAISPRWVVWQSILFFKIRNNLTKWDLRCTVQCVQSPIRFWPLGSRGIVLPRPFFLHPWSSSHRLPSNQGSKADPALIRGARRDHSTDEGTHPHRRLQVQVQPSAFLFEAASRWMDSSPEIQTQRDEGLTICLNMSPIRLF